MRYVTWSLQFILILFYFILIYFVLSIFLPQKTCLRIYTHVYNAITSQIFKSFNYKLLTYETGLTNCIVALCIVLFVIR